MQKNTSIVLSHDAVASNRRKYPRVAVSQEENLSLRGMFLATEQPQPVGSRIVVDIGIGLPNDPPLRAEAIVRWRKERRGMGVEFIAFEEQGKDRLEAWLKARETKT